MLYSLNQPDEKMNETFSGILAKVSLTNLGVFGLATWIDPQWATAGIAGISAIFPAIHYYHKSKQTKLENRILKKRLERMEDEEQEDYRA